MFYTVLITNEASSAMTSYRTKAAAEAAVRQYRERRAWMTEIGMNLAPCEVEIIKTAEDHGPFSV